VPYRDQHDVKEKRPERAHVARWIALREQFAHLSPQEVWPPPEHKAFDAHSIDRMAVSGDGSRIFVLSRGVAFVIDGTTLRARRLGEARFGAQAVAVTDNGSHAILTTGDRLLHWDLSGAVDQPRAIGGYFSLYNTEYISSSRDGRLIATSNQSQKATVRIFDVEADTLVYSFEADADEGMEMHPDGRHLICFGDNGEGVWYGESGKQQRVKRVGGGALSRDGKWLLTNSLEDSNALLRYPISCVNDVIESGALETITPRFRVETWSVFMRFSPSGDSALVEGYDDQAYLVDLHGRGVRPLWVEVKRGSGVLAGEDVAIVGCPRAQVSGKSVQVAHVIDTNSEKSVGLIVGMSEDETTTVAGTTPLEFYGTLEDPVSVERSLNAPYERADIPELILAGGDAENLEHADRVRMNEVSQRERAWSDYRRLLTADISLRELLEVNRGLLHLTPEIVHRAEHKLVDSPRFGKPQVNLSALREAEAELRAMSKAERDTVFHEMLTRLRGGKAPHVVKRTAPAAATSGKSLPAAMPALAPPEPARALEPVVATEIVVATPTELEKPAYGVPIAIGFAIVVAGLLGGLFFF
jgi:hypothetical protein